jgi:hypothetical protein
VRGGCGADVAGEQLARSSVMLSMPAGAQDLRVAAARTAGEYVQGPRVDATGVRRRVPPCIRREGRKSGRAQAPKSVIASQTSVGGIPLRRIARIASALKSRRQPREVFQPSPC